MTVPAGGVGCNRAALGTSQGYADAEGKTDMDSTAFDGLTRELAGGASRRGLLGSLGALTMSGAGLALFGQTDAAAKRKRKKHTKKNKKKNVKKQNQNRCADGIKNGAESDVDCGGGSGPRCQGGQICNSRNDCHTALCTGGTCQSCAAPDDCGLDSNGDTCFCRENAAKPGEKMCTRQTCKLFPGVPRETSAPPRALAPSSSARPAAPER